MIRISAARHQAMAALSSAVDRREAWLWIVAMFVLATVAIGAEDGSASGFMQALGAHNLIYWLCYAVIVQSIIGSADAALDRVSLYAFFGGALLLIGVGLVGISDLDGLMATALGLVLFRVYGDDPGLRRAGILFLALAVNLFWAQILFAVLKEQIVVLDALFAETMLNLMGYEVQRTVNTLSTNGAFYITIIGACSAFNNISLAILATVAVILGLRGTFQRRDLGGVLLVCLLLMAFNTGRLAIFASSRGAYEFWHNGDGAPVMALAQTILTLGAAALLTLRPRNADFA